MISFTWSVRVHSLKERNMKSKLNMSLQDWIVFIRFSMKVTVILIASSVFLWQMNVFHEDLEKGLTVATEETVIRKDAINPIIAICPKNEYLGQVPPPVFDPNANANDSFKACDQPEFEYNCTVLNSCEIYRIDYSSFGHYSSLFCPDPLALYYSLILPPSSNIYWQNGFIDQVQVHGLTQCLHLELASLQSNEILWWLKHYSDVYVYQNGTFLDTFQHGHPMKLYGAKDYKYHVDFNIVVKESTSEEPCDPDPDYSKDLCMWDEFTKNSLHWYNCTTPFGPDKSNICTDQFMGDKAMAYLKDQILFKTNDCLDSCTKIWSKWSLIEVDKWAYAPGLTITLPEMVRVTTQKLVNMETPKIIKIGANLGLNGFIIAVFYKIIDFIFYHFAPKN